LNDPVDSKRRAGRVVKEEICAVLDEFWRPAVGRLPPSEIGRRVIILGQSVSGERPGAVGRYRKDVAAGGKDPVRLTRMKGGACGKLDAQMDPAVCFLHP